MNEYSWIYNTSPSNSSRFTLGNCGHSPLLCIGVNPSTAVPENLDPTLKSVARIADNNSYDGWIMINLYPQRSTNPDGLHPQIDDALHQKNLDIIKTVLNTYEISDIWAAWGTLINKRSYLPGCLHDIYTLTAGYNWIRFGDLSKDGHPHHPLYLSSDTPKYSFNITDYVNSLTQDR